MVHCAFPRSRVLGIEHLAGGLRNANFKVHLDSRAGAIVVRVYEHDSSICQKELDLLGLLGACIPVPEALHAEPLALDDIAPFMILRYVEGVTFRDLVRTGDRVAIAEAAYHAQLRPRLQPRSIVRVLLFDLGEV
jgi:hypothetical protein